MDRDLELILQFCIIGIAFGLFLIGIDNEQTIRACMENYSYGTCLHTINR